MHDASSKFYFLYNFNSPVILPVSPIIGLHCAASNGVHSGLFGLEFSLASIHSAPAILKSEYLGIVRFAICFQHIFRSLPEFQKLIFAILIPDLVLSMAQCTYFLLAWVAATHLSLPPTKTLKFTLDYSASLAAVIAIVLLDFQLVAQLFVVFYLLRYSCGLVSCWLFLDGGCKSFRRCCFVF